MKEKYKILFPLIIIINVLLVNNIFAQDVITIRGKVINAENSKPVPYASIGILGKSVGTLSNDNGVFEFSFPKVYGKDTMFVYNLGYYSYRVLIKDIRNRTNFTVVLQPRSYTIKEVTITSHGTDAYKIVKRACDSLSSHLPPNPYIGEGFFREYINENGNWARAIEAALGVYDDARQHIGDHFYQSKIQGIRSTQNFLSAFTHSQNYNQVSLFLTSTLDVKWFLLNIDNLKFQVDSMIYMDGRLVWVISGTPEKTKRKTYVRNEYTIDKFTGQINKYQKKYTFEVEKNTDRFYQYKYFIEDSTYAFVRLEYQDTLYKPFICENVKTYKGLYTSYNSTKRILEYKYFKEKWYPQYICESKEIGYYKRRDSALFINVFRYADLMFNDYQTDFVREIPRPIRINPYEDLFNQGFPYDHNFWKKYNRIVDDNLRDEVFADLEFAKAEKDTTTVAKYLYALDSLKRNNINYDLADISDTASPEFDFFKYYYNIDTSILKPEFAENNDNLIVNPKIIDSSGQSLIFKIQISAGNKKLDPDNSSDFKGLKGVEMYYHKGLYKYTYGNVTSMSDALDLQKQLQSIGFKNAFIVPFYFGERITIDQAIQLLDAK